MKAKKIKFTVRRKNWLRGNTDTSTLLNDTGSMCCLGFLGRACGIKQKDLLFRDTPASCADIAESYPKSIVKKKKDKTWYVNSDICFQIMNINDKDKLSLSERESKLKTLFKKAGIEVTFK